MENYSKAVKLLTDADVIIVLAGNKMAKLEGLDLLGKGQFEQDFPAFAQKYDVHSIGDAFDQQISSWSEKWLFWSQLIEQYTNHYQPGEAMTNLLKIIGKKKYFVATSSFGHFFEQAGFNENRIFNVFGDWTLMHCSSGINHGTKDDRQMVQAFLAASKKGQNLADLVPQCSVCGQPMELHLPLNDHFYPDTDANTRFRWFLTGNEEENLVFLELGVDETSPQLFEPVIRLVQQFEPWHLIAADYPQADLPLDIQSKSAGLNADTATLIEQLDKNRDF